MMDRHPGARRTSGVALILFTLVAWASVPLFLRFFTDKIDGWTTNGWRYGASAIFWLPVLLFAAARRKLPRGLWKAAVVPSLFNIFAQIAFAWAPYYIYPGMLTFLLRLQIVFVAVGAYVLFPSERPILRSPTYIIGAITVFCGLLGLCFLGEAVPKGGTAFGIFLGFSAGILYGGYSLSVRHFMHEIHPAHAFGAICQFTAAGMIGLMLALGKSHGAVAWSLSWPLLEMLIASAMIGIAISHTTYYAALARLGVSLCVGVILLQPVLTSAASYFLFDERLTLRQWISGGVALTGGAVMLVTQWRVQRIAPDSRVRIAGIDAGRE